MSRGQLLLRLQNLHLGKALAVALLVIAGLGAYWLGKSVQPAVELRDRFYIEPADLDFGEAWETSNFEWAVRLRNDTDNDLHVKELLTSCDCISADPKSFDVPSKGTVKVRLKLDLTTSHIRLSASPVRKFEVPIRPVVQGWFGQGPGWTLHGLVKRPITFAEEIIEFGDSCVQGEPFPWRGVSVIAQSDQIGLEARCDPLLARVEVISDGNRRFLGFV